jgi:hypothetical protein
MAFFAAVGQSNAFDPKTAGRNAVKQALEQASRSPVTFAWVIASHAYIIKDVLQGAAELLGDVTLFGFSTSAELTGTGLRRKTVIVGLFFGGDIQCRANWWSHFGQDSQSATQKMLEGLLPSAEAHELLLVAADGLNGDAAYLSQEISKAGINLAGCLAGGELRQGRTYQMGGREAGTAGLAGAVLSGKLVMGVGASHGWEPVGALARLTQVQGNWVRTIDDQQASETYAKLFGFSAREWSFPPLNSIVRLYPLGVKAENGLKVRAPLRVEADGSLRMGTPIPEDSIVDIMVGTQVGCLQATRQAVQQAQEALGPSRPKLAVLIVDDAWRTIFEMQPGAEVKIVKQMLGEDVPIMGGYTFGQIARTDAESEAQLLNQHILVVLFGEARIIGTP